MAIRVFWAQPGPKADAALHRYWVLAHEIADDLIGRQILQQQTRTNDVIDREAKEVQEPGL